MAVVAPTRSNIRSGIIYMGGSCADAEVIFDSTDSTVTPTGALPGCDYIEILSTGTYTVQVSLDGGTTWSTAIGLFDLCGTSTAPVLAGVSTHLMRADVSAFDVKVTATSALSDFCLLAKTVAK